MCANVKPFSAPLFKAAGAKISYLGPDGSYSSVAAEKLLPEGFEKARGLPCKSFYSVVQALLGGDAEFAVLPVENTLQGAVTQNLDLLYAHPELVAVREYVMKIDHRLIAKEGTKLSEIRRLYSHEQAILQCGRFISRELPQAEIVYTDSTMQSVSRIRGVGDAGIVGSHVRAEGLAFIGENIADEPKNFTHFLLIVKGEERLPAHSSLVYFAATCSHEPGALLKMLQILSVYDLNMTKIESRPIKNSPGEYCFFIEFKGDIAEKNVRFALNRLSEYTKNFKLLGCY